MLLPGFFRNITVRFLTTFPEPPNPRPMKTSNGILHKLANGFRNLFSRNQSNTSCYGQIIYEGYISGYQYHRGTQLEHLFNSGTEFLLKHEPENPFDEDAVAVYYEDARIGFIPPTNNVEIVQLLRGGNQLKARIARFEPELEPWERVYVEVLNLPEEQLYQ